jgi:hypothetical protein
VEDDLVGLRPVVVATRFELAAKRIADGWLRARRLRVSRDDFQLARDFLARDGWRVEERPGLRVRLARRDVAVETTREGAVVVALRRLTAPADGWAAAVRAVPAFPAAPESSAPRPAAVPRAVSARARMRGAACPAELHA